MADWLNSKQHGKNSMTEIHDFIRELSFNAVITQCPKPHTTGGVLLNIINSDSLNHTLMSYGAPPS